MRDMANPGSATVEAREESSARRRFATLPGFSRELADAARFTRLVGLTNRVYAVEVGGERYALRIPGDGAATLVDRRAEALNARLAAKAGVAPEVVHFAEDGVMLTRFIEDAVPLSPARITESGGALQRGALALRRLHDAKIVFANTFDAFGFIESYLAVLERLGTPPTDGRLATVAEVRTAGEALAASPVPLKPCHCDPTGRNLLDTGERVWLVDWEYSGMNDPMWDLAYFSIESLLDDDGDRALMRAYFDAAPCPRDVARMAALKPVCDVQAALWALIQVGEGNPAGDFSGYAKTSFERAAARMRAVDFAGQLEVLRGG